MKWLVAVLAIGCGASQSSPPPPAPSSSPPETITCRRALDHLASIAPASDEQHTRDQTDFLVKHCNADGWAVQALQCFHDAATPKAAESCSGMLTQAQLLALAATHDDPRRAAAIDAKQYAFEAYPQWAMEHPDTACPGALAELREFTSFDSDLDPWGHPYRMMCGPSLPPGAKGVAIQSAGPDGQFDTADDVRSWE
jgi:hypothetical protein